MELAAPPRFVRCGVPDLTYRNFEGAVTQYAYDDRAGSGGRLTAKRYFDSLASFNNGNGTPQETTSYEYDVFGRVREVKTEREFLPLPIEHTKTFYDGQGGVTRIESLEGTVEYVYDALGRKITTLAFGGTPTNPNAETLVTEFGYDGQSRLTTVTVSRRNGQALQSPEVTAYKFTLSGELDEQLQANGTKVDNVFDQLGRLDKVRHLRPDGTLEVEFDYTLRADGKRISEKITNANGEIGEYDWDYDAAGRLTEEVFDDMNGSLDYKTNYNFDLAGNRVQRLVDRGNDGIVDEQTDYRVDAADRLLEETLDLLSGQDTRTVYAWGTNGSKTHQTSKTVFNVGTADPVERTEFGYNLRGQLKQSQRTTSWERETTTFAYGDNGIRVLATSVTETGGEGNWTSQGGHTTVYLNDPLNFTGYSQVIVETKTEGGLIEQRSYTLGVDLIAQANSVWDSNSETYSAPIVITLVYDGHGSTRGWTDQYGSFNSESGQGVILYDAYGQIFSTGLTGANSPTNYLYSGEQWDQRVQMQYLRARYSSSANGRFSLLDPFTGVPAEPQSWHKYGYAYGDPVNRDDPSGLFPGFPWPRLFPGRPLPDEIQIPVLGTLVHSYIGREFRSWAGSFGLRPWANQQNRTIVSDITGVSFPNSPPYSFKPDLVSYAGGPAPVNLYELKHADIILNAPFYLGQSLLATAQLTTHAFFPLSAMAPTLAFGFGTAFATGYNLWPAFPWSPPGWELVTWNDYAAFPGVILYDWVPTREAVEIAALASVGAIAVALHLQHMAALSTASTAAVAGSQVVRAERALRAAAEPLLVTAATVMLAVRIGF